MNENKHLLSVGIFFLMPLLIFSCSTRPRANCDLNNFTDEISIVGYENIEDLVIGKYELFADTYAVEPLGFLHIQPDGTYCYEQNPSVDPPEQLLEDLVFLSTQIGEYEVNINTSISLNDFEFGRGNKVYIDYLGYIFLSSDQSVRFDALTIVLWGDHISMGEMGATMPDQTYHWYLRRELVD